MKKVLSILIIAVMLVAGVFLLTGCGEQKENNNGGGNNNQNPNGEYQGDTTGASDLSNVTDKNYKEVAKNVMGITISDNNGWTLTRAESPNRVNNLNIYWTVENGSDPETILKDYFDQCLQLSTDGIYSMKYGQNYSVVKDEKYDSFTSYFDKAATKMSGGFYQVKWIYDNNGKSIQFTMTIEETKANVSFSLLG